MSRGIVVNMEVGRIVMALAVLLVLAGGTARAQRCGSSKAAERFVVEPGGTVHDRRTGLTWSRCMLGQTWNGKDCGPLHHWEVQYTWRGAMRQARATTVAGKTDWRLPTLAELRSLLYTGCGAGQLNRELFVGSAPFPFWSTTEFAANPAYAWRVDFTSGKQNADLKDTPTYVARPVRGKPWPPRRKPPETRDKTPRDSLASDGIHDRSLPALSVLQRPAKALDNLPRDERGGVDWVAAMAHGLIEPRSGVSGEGYLAIIDLDVVMRDTAQMGPVVFPHRTHTELLTCAACHPEPFRQRAGTTPVDMAGILQGRWCGRCHGRVAFSPMTCERCHRSEQVASAGGGDQQ